MKNKIHYVIPWDDDKNIGRSYNSVMKNLNSNDWACFVDGDALHTTIYFGNYIREVIKNNPFYGLFTCYTNRVIRPYQIAPMVDVESNDIEYHRNFGSSLWEQNKTNVKDITDLPPLSGVMILIRRRDWRFVGGFKEEKMLGIDNDIHIKFKNAGLRVGLMEGIYVYHWYRNGNPRDNGHLK